MMKLAGHTMGTPEMNLFEAIEFFGKTGLDGIEIISETDGYPCALPQSAGEALKRETKARLEAAGLEVSAMTPYLNLFNSLNEAERRAECDSLKTVIDTAAFFGAPNIRVYGGKFVDGESDEDGRKLDALARSMRECGDYCEGRGVRLTLENHFGTMTTTANRTMEIMRAIDHKNVGVLYDQANLAFFPAEEYEEAIALQRDKIYYVHVKDLVYRGGVAQPPKFNMVSHVKEDERTVYSRIPGDGILDWPAILRLLRDIGYDGWLSLEYERRWQRTDLPDAREGMPRAAAYIREILNTL